MVCNPCIRKHMLSPSECPKCSKDISEEKLTNNELVQEIIHCSLKTRPKNGKSYNMQNLAVVNHSYFEDDSQKVDELQENRDCLVVGGVQELKDSKVEDVIEDHSCLEDSSQELVKLQKNGHSEEIQELIELNDSEDGDVIKGHLQPEGSSQKIDELQKSDDSMEIVELEELNDLQDWVVIDGPLNCEYARQELEGTKDSDKEQESPVLDDLEDGNSTESEFVFVETEENVSIKGLGALFANNMVLQNQQDRTSDPLLWYEDFKIPWEKMPLNLIYILDQARRPSKKLMEMMAKIICEEIRKFDLNPNEQILNIIARKAVEWFPESLSDDPAVPLSKLKCQDLQTLLKNKLMDYFDVKVKLTDIRYDINISFRQLCQCNDQLCQNDMPKLNAHSVPHLTAIELNQNKFNKPLLFRGKWSGCRPKTNMKKQLTKKYRYQNKKENIKPSKLVNYHCCDNWRPRKLPKNETKCSQLQKKEQLRTIGASSPNILNDQTIQLLEETFYSQRRDIIMSKNIMIIIKEWPLLFTKDGLLNHFKLLTGVDSLKKLTDSLLTKANIIFYYFLILSKNGSKPLKRFFKILDKSENLNGIECSFIIIFLTMVYFDEAHETLFLTIKVPKTESATAYFQILPKTPRLIMCGDSPFSASNYMLCIDGKIVNREITDFTSGFIMLFASYLIFDIPYPKETKATLEFAERYLFDIHSRKNISDIRVFNLVKILEYYRQKELQ